MAETVILPSLIRNKTETFRAEPRPICRFFGSGGGCTEPAVPGSPYCVTHRRLCVIDPGTNDGARAIRDLEREALRPSAVPPEFLHLIDQRLPELEADDEPRDIAGCVDLAPRDERDDGDAA